MLTFPDISIFCWSVEQKLSQCCVKWFDLRFFSDIGILCGVKLFDLRFFFRYRYLVEVFFLVPLHFSFVGFLKKFALICFFFVLFLQLAQSNNNCFSKEKDPKCFGTEYNGVSVVLIALRFSSEKLMSDNCNPAHHLLICWFVDLPTKLILGTIWFLAMKTTMMRK